MSDKKTVSRPVKTPTRRKSRMSNFWIYFIISVLIAFIANQFTVNDNKIDDTAESLASTSELYVNEYLIDKTNEIELLDSESILRLKSTGFTSDYLSLLSDSVNKIETKVDTLNDINIYLPTTKRKALVKNSTTLEESFIDYVFALKQLDLISEENGSKDYLYNVKIKKLNYYSELYLYVGNLKDYTSNY